jgi:hypothetical protein
MFGNSDLTKSVVPPVQPSAVTNISSGGGLSVLRTLNVRFKSSIRFRVVIIIETPEEIISRKNPYRAANSLVFEFIASAHVSQTGEEG